MGSAALYIHSACTNVDLRNNIFVNNRDESPYSSSSIYTYSVSNLKSDYNDLYYNKNTYNSLVRYGMSIKYYNLPEWQTKAEDLNSITEMPNFIVPDLHIDKSIPTDIESHGTPITGIDLDIDGDARSAISTDIGADEFDGIVSAAETENNLPLEFALSQNYPNPFNPVTKIKYTIPNTHSPLPGGAGGGLVTLKVYDVLGREVTTLVNETKQPGAYEVEFNANNLPTGVYFYRLKATPIGGQAVEFIHTRKMILLK